MDQISVVMLSAENTLQSKLQGYWKPTANDACTILRLIFTLSVMMSMETVQFSLILQCINPVCIPTDSQQFVPYHSVPTIVPTIKNSVYVV